MIIDVHCHLGINRVWGNEISEDQVLRMLDEHEIDVAIIQPYFVSPTMEAQQDAHDRIYRFIKEHPNRRIYGMASLNPHIDYDDYRTEVRRCVDDLGFVGLKLHPVYHGCDPLMPDGATPFRAAQEFNIPLMVHTGFGSPVADPSHLLPRAREFPELTIVMAHLGIAEKVQEALAVMKECPNLYADLSLVVSFMVPVILGAVSVQRLMFGSDINQNCAIELAKIRHWVQDEAELNWILAKTAQQVYKV